jgi:hypothetical protein
MMPTPADPLRYPFDDAAAAALTAQLRGAAQHCDQARLALRRDRDLVAESWRGPAGDDALDRAGRIVAELERVASACAHRAEWLEAVRANVAATMTPEPPGLHLSGGLRIGPPLVPSARPVVGG